ncbi:protein kinase COQ8 Ecym_3052 [Eremothecium cymbalariae DBVPG|uniref:ABC1 atypical kinase-like domain-containing protein n=1 Tax=Eremothecium cymbalariae (strain CBS 270.75 / DBVPG 7215 / KCTC 17166 / NRRL Y-17582) TaxID=931890 RepID=G8JQZ5_ERECY|nr:Hypothetical protein Ecym_3052 [Eremothecium cymbalariae DBVPG\
MVSARSLYNTARVLMSAKDVVVGSLNIGKESFMSWVSSRVGGRKTVLSDLLQKDERQWEAAKRLSADIKNASGAGKSNSGGLAGKIGVRQYSTDSRKQRDPNDGDKWYQEQQEQKRRQRQELQSSQIPSTRISRLFHYGSLAAGVGLSVASQGLSNLAQGQSPSMKSLLLSDTNMDRIAKKLSQMRGAALKIGQMMSFQDSRILPPEMYQILSRVQNSAHYMPPRQLDRLLIRELGRDWESKFASFSRIPIAAASIGQVHEATLPDGTECVVKVQYPGVRDSIDSDLNNVLMLLTATAFLPKGLFLDKTIANARKELKWECDYLREAQALKEFGKLLKDDPVFVVPRVFDELTTSNILTMSKMTGIEIMKLPKELETQEIRDFICENIMRLCLQEICQFKYMQTDPNWANFLYNHGTGKIELLDFGASRSFPEKFIRNYRKTLTYGTQNNPDGVRRMSKELGYLTGSESEIMVDAHVDSVMALSEPFSGDPKIPFDFSNQDVSDRVRGKIGVMLNERLCPPPEETYSLNRKFSGVFLLCARMNSKVHCAKLFEEIFALNED